MLNSLPGYQIGLELWKVLTSVLHFEDNTSWQFGLALLVQKNLEIPSYRGYLLSIKWQNVTQSETESNELKQR